MLQSALEREPDNARYAYYLAQSWRDAGCPHEALAGYRRRIEMGGWAEEVWCSMHEVAKLLEKTGADRDSVVGAYLRAYEFRPTRAESLTKLAMYLRHRKQWPTAYLFASAALQIPRPADPWYVVLNDEERQKRFQLLGISQEITSTLSSFAPRK